MAESFNSYESKSESEIQLPVKDMRIHRRQKNLVFGTLKDINNSNFGMASIQIQEAIKLEENCQQSSLFALAGDVDVGLAEACVSPHFTKIRDINTFDKREIELWEVIVDKVNYQIIYFGETRVFNRI